MPLVFCALAPHSPLLLPSIGREKIKELSQTITALHQLEQDLYLAKPQILIVLSPHTGLFNDAFTINAHDNFKGDFGEFGHINDKYTYPGTPDLAAKISHVAKMQQLPLRLISDERLDHGSTIPLSYLGGHLPQLKILPIGFSGLGRATHLQFGTMLKDIFLSHPKNIAVVSSGDMSHRVSTESPAGYHADGAKFDEYITSALERHDLEALINIAPELVANAQECSYRSLLILLGVLQKMNFQFENYCYEAPFGIGHLTGLFFLS